MALTPNSERLYIGIYGRRNSGKSSLINALTGQDIALVSSTPGTTTDPVHKAIELPNLGACTIIDTAGYDDDAVELGALRVSRSLRTLEQVNIALVLISSEAVRQGQDWELEGKWLKELDRHRIPTVVILSQSDKVEDEDSLLHNLRVELKLPKEIPSLSVSAHTGYGLEGLRELLPRLLPEDFGNQTITRGLCTSGDVVVLVMPQDASAPKGRLILPQVQTIRELLDKGCTVVSCTPEGLSGSLASLSAPPKLIITDSQAFSSVYPLKPEDSLLTSFSVLFAAYKGDIDLFVEGAKVLDRLSSSSKVLIAEACTHAPQTEDIGRVKIPNLLRKRYGDLKIEIASGLNYPESLSGYDLIIHCGSCMYSRAHTLRRLGRAQAQGIPITNYGICLAHLTGILDKITY